MQHLQKTWGVTINQKPRENFRSEERGASTGRFGPGEKDFSSHPVRKSLLSSTATNIKYFFSAD